MLGRFNTKKPGQCLLILDFTTSNQIKRVNKVSMDKSQKNGFTNPLSRFNDDKLMIFSFL